MKYFPGSVLADIGSGRMMLCIVHAENGLFVDVPIIASLTDGSKIFIVKMPHSYTASWDKTESAFL